MQFSCYTSSLVLNSRNLLRKQDIRHSEFVANIYLSLLKNLCFGLHWHSLVLFCFSVSVLRLASVQLLALTIGVLVSTFLLEEWGPSGARVLLGRREGGHLVQSWIWV